MSEVFVPALDETVTVRRIPPKLIRIIQSRAVKRGRCDVEALMALKLVHGVVGPNWTEAEAREVLRNHSDRVLDPVFDRIDELSGTGEHLHQQDSGPSSMRKITEVAIMARAWLQRSTPAAAPREGRAPREATNTRQRGSRRVTGSGTTSSGEDPGESDQRACANCTRPLAPDSAPQRIFCEDLACKRERDRERKRQAPVRLRPRSEYATKRVHWAERTDDYDPDLDWVGAVAYVLEYGSGAPKLRGRDLAVADNWELLAAVEEPCDLPWVRAHPRASAPTLFGWAVEVYEPALEALEVAA